MRVLVYDKTCVRSGNRLSIAWTAGSGLYRALGRIDASHGVASWGEALAWLATIDQPIEELQYWGHGKWGGALVDDELLDVRSLGRDHQHRAGLDVLRGKLAPDALIWFRTCETFGARAGITFAEQLADFLGARVAGHTYVIAFQQSGLHGLAPGTRADWSPEEGLVEGTPEHPRRARWSHRSAPHTITALSGRIPVEWFAR
ncbi:hypothetical protein BH11MYX3_BH11MYX3_42800 [soil metagenome]